MIFIKICSKCTIGKTMNIKNITVHNNELWQLTFTRLIRWVSNKSSRNMFTELLEKKVILLQQYFIHSKTYNSNNRNKFVQHLTFLYISQFLFLLIWGDSYILYQYSQSLDWLKKGPYNNASNRAYFRALGKSSDLFPPILPLMFLQKYFPSVFNNTRLQNILALNSFL